MRTIKADLLADVVGSYDQTKTTIQGRVFQKTINSKEVLGPPLTKFIDVFTDTGLLPNMILGTENGRLFITVIPLDGTTYDLMPILLYDLNYSTGDYSYVGRIDVRLPNLAATVSTVRGFKVIDTGTTNWKLFIATTATIAINGGAFLVNKINKADFNNVTPTEIPMATSSDAKAIYFLQDPSNIGVNQLNIASAGLILDADNNAFFVHNGVSATHQYYKYSTSAPTYTDSSVNVSVGSPGVVTHTAHPFNNNDPVIFTEATSLPTGLTLGTVYFVRNPLANSYNLSLTSGGANINTTGSASVGAKIGRAWGTTGSNWLYKTGNLPALTGTMLLLNCEYRAVPINSPINGGVLNGNPCAFIATSTQLYLGRLSELTNGTTSWPSLSTSNILAGTNEIVTPTAINASWSNVLDSATYVTNTSKFIVKPLVNNSIQANFGELNNIYYEQSSRPVVIGQRSAPTSIDHTNGWLLTASTAVGQRGVFLFDMQSDAFYEEAMIITKVLNTAKGQMKLLSSYEELWQSTGNIKIQYRTSGFASISGGWVDISQYTDLSSIATYDEIQFKILFRIQSEESSNPAQVNELLLTLLSDLEISEHWEYSDDFSDNTSPSRTTFRLKKLYLSSVPTLNYKAYDLSDVLLVNHDTVTNATNFEYSTNNGTTWLPLGTIPNTVGTLVRYTFSSPPGVDIRPVIREL